MDPVRIAREPDDSAATTNFSFTGREFRSYVTSVQRRGFLKSSAVPFVSLTLIFLSEIFYATLLL